jgi:uncharacterized phage protein (TIGR01671 family)
MSREIKFRGRKNSTKEWIYGSLITDKTKGYAIIQITDNPISNGVVNGWCFGIEKGTECQYTGLKDKDGKEIYEGDIIKTPKGIAPVTFDLGCFYVITESRYRLGGWDQDAKEVIGNIYENPNCSNDHPNQP